MPKTKKRKAKKKQRRIKIARPTIGIVRVKQWRDKKTGKFRRKPRTKTERRKVQEVEFSYRVDHYGRHKSGIKYAQLERVTKKIPTSTLSEWNGSYGDALDSSNAISTMMRYDAAAVDVTIQGWIVRGGTRRLMDIKLSLDVAAIRDRSMVRQVLLMKIKEAMDRAGVRTQYRTELITQWSKLKTPKWAAEQRQELQNATINVVVRRFKHARSRHRR